MTQFNPENKSKLTIGEALGPAMKITDKADALQYKAAYIAFMEKQIEEEGTDLQGKNVDEVANSNLGYYAGYYSNETRARVEELFDCAHPVFGSIVDNGAPTTEEVFNAGKEFGEKAIAGNSKKAVWKFDLEVTDIQTISIPSEFKILSIQVQDNTPRIWALVDPSKPAQRVQLLTFGTGHPIEGSNLTKVTRGEFIGTYQMNGGTLVFHVFRAG